MAIRELERRSMLAMAPVSAAGLQRLAPPGVLDTRAMGFTKAMIVPPGPMLYTGAVGYDHDWKLTGDGGLEAQLRQCARNLKLLLSEAGCTARDIVHLRFYIVNLKPDDRHLLKRVMEEELYDKEARPTTSLLGISALARADLLAEIELTAAVPV